MELKLKYWAALGKEGKIIAVGFTIIGDRFDRRCFPFANETFEIWHVNGAKYCQLNIPQSPLQYIGQNIKDVPHGRIRKSKDSYSILKSFS